MKNSMDMFKSLLSKLEDDLDDIEQCMKFVQSANELRPRLGNIFSATSSWGKMDQIDKTLAKEFINSKEVRLEVIFGTLYIGVHASFEDFVKCLVKKAVECINSKKLPNDKLKKELIDENLHYSGIALSTIKKPTDHYEFNYPQIASTLVTCYSDCVKLNAEAISIQSGGVTPENIKSLFKRICIEIDWDHLFTDNELKELEDLCDEITGKGKRRTAKKIQEYISTMVTKRNQIVHTSGAASISYTDLDIQIKFVRKLAEALSKYVKKNMPVK